MPATAIASLTRKIRPGPDFACQAARDEAKVAQANLDINNVLLEETFLRAPFAGIVAEINGEIGEYVTPSPPGVATPPAVDLIDYSCLYVTAPIDEVDAGELHPGLPARVSLDALDAGAADYLPKNFEDISRNPDKVRQMLCERVTALARTNRRSLGLHSTPSPAAATAPRLRAGQ